MSMLTLYFLVMLDSIGHFFTLISIGGCIISFLMIVVGYAAINDGGNEEYWLKVRKRAVKILIPITLLFTFISFIIPSTKQVAFIYVVGSLSQNKIVQNIGNQSLQIPEKALEILNVKMNSYLEDMKQEALKETKDAVKEVSK